MNALGAAVAAQEAQAADTGTSVCEDLQLGLVSAGKLNNAI